VAALAQGHEGVMAKPLMDRGKMPCLAAAWAITVRMRL
jgi:hypothetical protein